MVDSLTDDAGSKLRRIEEELFIEMVKFEVEAALGPWIGSVEQNRSADMKISRCVKSSFRVYEKCRNYEGTYFKF